MEEQSDIPSTSRINVKVMNYLKQFGHKRNLDKFMRISSPTGSNLNDGASKEIHSSCATQVITDIVNTNNSSCCSNAMNADSFDGSCMQMLFDDELHSKSASAFKTVPSFKTHMEEKPDCTGHIHTNNDKVITIEIKKQQLANKNLFCASVDNLQTPQKIHAVTKCTQTPDSIIKLHKRLEWDSFGDVGYKKSSSTSNINTLERSVLKEIFHDGSVRGHSNKSKVNASESDLKSLQNEQTTTTPLASSTFVNLPHSRRGTQPKSTQTTFSKLPKMYDQSVQTSVLRKSMESQSVYVGSSATPSSFEYFSSPSPPTATSHKIPINCNQQKGSINIHHVYNTQLNEMYAEHQMLNQQNQSPISSNTAACADIRRTKAQLNANEEEENVKTQIRTDQPLPSNITDNIEFRATDLDLGVKLLCSLVNAKSLCHKKKKELIKEIAKRISCIDSAASSNSTNTNTTTDNTNSTNTTTGKTASRRSNRYIVPPRLQESINEKENNLESVSLALKIRRDSITNVDDTTIKTKENEPNNGQINNTVIAETFERNSIHPKRISNTAKSTINEGITIMSSNGQNTNKKKSTVSSASQPNNKKSEIDLMEQRIMREWLDPMTQSEIEYEGKQHNKKKHKVPFSVINKVPPNHTMTNPTIADDGMRVDTENKITQLNWVETEIKRLEDLRILLSKDTMLPVDSMGIPRNNSDSNNVKVIVATSETQMQNLIPINNDHDNQDDHVYDSVIEDNDLVCKIKITKEKTYEKVRSHFDKIALSTKIKESNIKIIPIHRETAPEKITRTALKPSSSSTFQATQRAKVPTPTESDLSTESSSCTPSDRVHHVESVCSLVQQRKREFMEHYNNKKRKQLELLHKQQQEGTNNNRQLVTRRQQQQQQQHQDMLDMQNSCQLLNHCQHVVSITKKCTKRCCICMNTSAVKNKKNKDSQTNKIDEERNYNNWPCTNVTAAAVTTTTTTTTLSTMTNMCTTSRSPDINTSKSGSTVRNNSISISKTSSIFGVSSDISIPMGTSCSSGTTTVTSTTHQYDDVAGLCAPPSRSIGIQTSSSMHHNRTGKYLSKRDAMQTKTNFNINNTQSTQCVQVRPRGIAYCIEFTTDGHTLTTQIDGKNNIDTPIAETEVETSRTCIEPLPSLQDHLQRSRPKFCAKSKERKSILNRMQILRAKRKKELENIIENTSFSSLDRRLEALPPPATSCIRVFSTQEMKALTSKRCKILPEVIERQQRKKEEHIRRNNRILRDIFNSRLQRRVRSGKISLNHSLTII